MQSDALTLGVLATSRRLETGALARRPGGGSRAQGRRGTNQAIERLEQVGEHVQTPHDATNQ